LKAISCESPPKKGFFMKRLAHMVVLVRNFVSCAFAARCLNCHRRGLPKKAWYCSEECEKEDSYRIENPW
jgi:hypothetical protein